MLDSLFGFFHHFKLIKKDVDVSLLLAEVQGKEHLWSTSRGTKIRVQRETVNIALRIPKPPVRKGKPIKSSNDIQASMNSPLAFEFPQIIEWVNDFAREQKATVCRVNIVALLPQSRVYSHIDHGLYYAPRDRYHLVLKSEGSKMYNGGEEAIFKTGEVWWYHNKVPHQSFNPSQEKRIHLIFDILPHSYLTILKNLFFWVYFNLRPSRMFHNQNKRREKERKLT